MLGAKSLYSHHPLFISEPRPRLCQWWNSYGLPFFCRKTPNRSVLEVSQPCHLGKTIDITGGGFPFSTLFCEMEGRAISVGIAANGFLSVRVAAP